MLDTLLLNRLYMVDSFRADPGILTYREQKYARTNYVNIIGHQTLYN